LVLIDLLMFLTRANINEAYHDVIVNVFSWCGYHQKL